MLRELTAIIPRESLTAAMVWVGIGAAVVGAVLWLLGVRFHRYLVTLPAVAVGACLGRLAPGWLGLTFDPMVGTIVGALVLGITGFMLHRLWGSLALGMILGLWAMLGSWIWLAKGAAVTWPKREPDATLAGYLHEVWASLPADFTRISPWLMLCAGVVGLAIGIVRWRVGAAMLYSLAGTTLLAAGSLVAVEASRRTGYSQELSHSAWIQGLILGCVLAVGFVAQWLQGRKLWSRGGSVPASPPAVPAAGVA